MASAAVIGMGLSIVGVFLVYITFSETREANIIAKRAADDAANEAKSSRDALILMQRAVVRIISIRTSPAERDGWLEVTFDVQNDGQSNAYQFTIEYSHVDEAIFPENLRYTQHISKVLPPYNRSNFPDFATRTPKSFPSYMIGALSYATVHGTIFRTFFCMKMEAPPGRDELGGVINNILDPVFCPSMPRDS